jgi:hypothetical protein
MNMARMIEHIKFLNNEQPQGIIDYEDTKS